MEDCELTLESARRYDGSRDSFYAVEFRYGGQLIHATYYVGGDRLQIHEWYLIPEGELAGVEARLMERLSKMGEVA